MTTINTLVLLPAKARQTVYVTYGILALASSSTQVGYAAANITTPTWLTIALAVIGFLAVPVGALAALNVTPATRGQDTRAEYVPERAFDGNGDGKPDVADEDQDATGFSFGH